MTALDGAAVIDTAELAGRNQPKAATPEVCSAEIAVYDALELAARKPPFNVKMSGRRRRSS